MVNLASLGAEEGRDVENTELWSQEGEVGWDEVREEGRPGLPSNVLGVRHKSEPITQGY